MRLVRQVLVAALEVGEHGKDAAVVAVGRRQPELAEDAGDVLLDRADGEHERLRMPAFERPSAIRDSTSSSRGVSDWIW